MRVTLSRTRRALVSFVEPRRLVFRRVRITVSTMLGLLICLYIFAVLQCVSARTLNGVIHGVPQEAIDLALQNPDTPIVNGADFQSRFDIRLFPITSSYDPLKTKMIVVKKDYSFFASQLTEGEYELKVSSHDFELERSHYRIIVTDTEVQAYESLSTLNGYNKSSKVVVDETPLVVQVLGWKEYYESPQSKLTQMVMNSPFGFIFKSTLYTSLFTGCLVIMVAPYIISFIAPELSEQLNAEQDEASKTET